MPIVVYVSPSGAHAASAGTFLLYAAHIAAMAPGTNIGAAAPVGLVSSERVQDTEKHSIKRPVELIKAENDAVAQIKSLAQLHGRNAEWAEEAIVKAASISADQALKIHVIDYKADTIEDLLHQLNGKKILFQNNTITLKTIPFQIVEISPGWVYKWLSLITQPNVAYLLLIFGLYGILFELYNPGFLAPGVLGIVSLLIAGYALSILPITETGLLLIILAFIFFLSELFITSGILAIAGGIAFVVGSLLLFDSAAGLQISLNIIISMSVLTGIFITAIFYLALKSRKSQQITGDAQLFHAKAIALEDFHANEQRNEGWVLINGERWHAFSEERILKDDVLKIIKRENLNVWVVKEV